MIEITFIEIVLFAWAVLATAAAFKFREEVRAMRRMMQLFVENKSARDQLVKAHEEFMKEQT
jgi:hypothetical protein